MFLVLSVGSVNFVPAVRRPVRFGYSPCFLSLGHCVNNKNLRDTETILAVRDLSSCLRKGWKKSTSKARRRGNQSTSHRSLFQANRRYQVVILFLGNNIQEIYSGVLSQGYFLLEKNVIASTTRCYYTSTTIYVPGAIRGVSSAMQFKDIPPEGVLETFYVYIKFLDDGS